MRLWGKGRVNGHRCVGREETLIQPLKPTPFSSSIGERVLGEDSLVLDLTDCFNNMGSGFRSLLLLLSSSSGNSGEEIKMQYVFPCVIYSLRVCTICNVHSVLPVYYLCSTTFFFQLEINHPGFSIAHGSLPVTYSLAAVREI